MQNETWRGDACSLVQAFRSGERSPKEELEASLAAMENSDLGAFCHVDADAARAAVESADVSLPFGGVPMAIKELEAVEGWPFSEASLVFRDRRADRDSTQVTRLRAAGAVLVAQTAAPEFGGVNYTHSKIHGTTRNPWNRERTPGGSSGGSAAAVAGGLLPIASASDGGGSIRIPAGFSGLFGLKSTFGRIPKGPNAHQPPLTVTVGCLSRSVRDTARWFDVCNGFDPRDTLSLPRVEGWESGLGSFDLTGKRAAIAIDLGFAFVEPVQTAMLIERAEQLIARAGMTRVDIAIKLPPGGREWSLSNSIMLAGVLGDRYPACDEELTMEIRAGLRIATSKLNLQTAGAAEMFRTRVNEQFADIFEHTDFIFAATNPDVAFAAGGPMPTTVGTLDLVAEYGHAIAIGNNGALTIPANLTGNPAVSIPSGVVDGLPVGIQVIGRHHEDQLLLELAQLSEREFPWPLVATSI